MKNLKEEMKSYMEVNLNEDVINKLRKNMEEAEINLAIVRRAQKRAIVDLKEEQEIEEDEMEFQLYLAKEAFNKVFVEKDLINKMLELVK